MDRPNDTQQPPVPRSKSSKSASKLNTSYLILYNAISAILWGTVLGRVVLIAALHGTRSVFFGAGEFTKWTQTLAGLEILHAAFGVVRAPLFTTIMQVASRFLLVWGIVEPFPHLAMFSSAYTSMLVAWSVTEVIRYGYFAVNLTWGTVPGWLLWLRYNTFFVLYPVGIASECWLVWLATEPAQKMFEGAQWALIGVLVVYVPGAYILFTHMMAQRRKVLRGDVKSVNKQK